jgi:hypothetical protein
LQIIRQHCPFTEISMRIFWTALLLWAYSSSALAIPFDPVSAPAGATNTGFLYSGSLSGVETASFTYDNTSGSMSYSVHRADGFGLGTVDAFLSWGMTVNALGELQGSGNASLALDLGHGIEVVALGSIQDFGFENVSCSSGQCQLIRPQLLVETSFVDPRVSSFVGKSWLWTLSVDFRDQLHDASGAHPVLAASVSCSNAASVNCLRHSGDFIQFYDVPEPASLTLMGFVFAGAFLALRVRRRRPRVLA